MRASDRRFVLCLQEIPAQAKVHGCRGNRITSVRRGVVTHRNRELRKWHLHPCAAAVLSRRGLAVLGEGCRGVL